MCEPGYRGEKDIIRYTLAGPGGVFGGARLASRTAMMGNDWKRDVCGKPNVLKEVLSKYASNAAAGQLLRNELKNFGSVHEHNTNKILLPRSFFLLEGRRPLKALAIALAESNSTLIGHPDRRSTAFPTAFELPSAEGGSQQCRGRRGVRHKASRSLTRS